MEYKLIPVAILFLNIHPTVLQAITKQFAEVLHFTISFDELKVCQHAVQFEIQPSNE